MILVLTYHMVGETPVGAEPNFYTVSARQFDRQLEALKNSRSQPVSVEHLVKNGVPPDNRHLLTFDDGTADHYEIVFPLLQKHGMRGLFFVPTANVDQRGFLTRGQVRELVAAGHVIGLHGHQHLRMDQSSPEEVRRQFELSQNIIADLAGSKTAAFRRRADSSTIASAMPPRNAVSASSEPCIGVTIAIPSCSRLKPSPSTGYTTDEKFLDILNARNFRLLYAGKEILKRMIPLRAYESLRRLMFKFSKTD